MSRTEDQVLKALLSVEDKPEKDVYMKRFGVNFRIQALDGDLINRIQEQATFITPKGEKKINEQKFGALVIQKACLVPNWAAPELLEKYGTNDPTDVIKKRLLAGEIAKLSAEIMELSGFNDDGEELKN